MGTQYGTIAYTANGRINVAETLRKTAIALRPEKRAFHARDIVALLKGQGYEIAESRVRSQLAYSGSGYTGRPRKRQFWTLEKRDAGMYKLVKWESDPNAPLDEMLKRIEE